MGKTIKTRDLFLVGIGCTYMFAFASIYVQIPGLFGKNGILPVGSLLKNLKDENKGKSAEALFVKTPTLLWFMRTEPDVSMEILSITGIVLSFLTTIFNRLRIWPTFLGLWLLYLSIYKVGETFMWFQWDILLLEVGFLSILVAPSTGKLNNQSFDSRVHREIPFYLVKWLLFRLMFASGVVKLTSRCPTWWKLTALNYHYETQCIPTPLAWWAHQLPEYIDQLSVIVTYVIEILLPFFFFLPLRIPRLFACYGQIVLMTAIFLSGNYNFFNILTAILCLSLVDDEHLQYLKGLLTFNRLKEDESSKKQRKQARFTKFVKLILNIICFLTLYSIICQLFGYDNKTHFKIKFTAENLEGFLERGMPSIVWLGAIGYVATVLDALYKSLFRKNAAGLWKPFTSFIKFLLIFGASTYLFAISVVRFSDVYPSFKSNIWPVVEKWHHDSAAFDLVHSYGLFRRMTGVGGRPEVIIEGSNSIHEQDMGEWKEYHFLYKPGAVDGSLPWVAPHQPRLDWQMWFASLSNYRYNSWIISLMHRLLLGKQEVLDLLDQSSNPFPDRPPKLLRAILYHYHYTNLSADFTYTKDVWKRTFQNIYVPPITKDDKTLVDFLKYNKLLPVTTKKSKQSYATSFTKSIRSFVSQIQPPVFLWSLAVTAFLISHVTSYIMESSKKRENNH